MLVSAIRWYVLAFAVLAFLTATVLDGVMMRYMVHPYLRVVERKIGKPLALRGFLALMVERAWMRRAYHLLFAGVLLLLWWYLGTPEGAARFLPR